MASLPAPPGEAATGADRRAESRHVIVALAELIELGKEGDPMSGLLRDISASGAKFLVNRHLEIGCRLEVVIRFQIDDQDRVIRRSGSLVRSDLLEPLRMGLWVRSVGIRFDQPIDERASSLHALAIAAARTAT